jgi:hypothetical protein
MLGLVLPSTTRLALLLAGQSGVFKICHPNIFELLALLSWLSFVTQALAVPAPFICSVIT